LSLRVRTGVNLENELDPPKIFPANNKKENHSEHFLQRFPSGRRNRKGDVTTASEKTPIIRNTVKSCPSKDDHGQLDDRRWRGIAGLFLNKGSMTHKNTKEHIPNSQDEKRNQKGIREQTLYTM